MPLRCFGCADSSASVLCVSRFGSWCALSLRRFDRVVSSVSVLGASRFGSSMAGLDFSHLGSPLSGRALGFLPSGCSLSSWAARELPGCRLPSISARDFLLL